MRLLKTVLPMMLVISLFGAVETNAGDLEDIQAKVEEIAERLSELGYTVDLSEITIRLKTNNELVAEDSCRTIPPNEVINTYRFFDAALIGDREGLTRTELPHHCYHWVAAIYSDKNTSITVVKEGFEEDPESIDATLAHELIHAYQHQNHPEIFLYQDDFQSGNVSKEQTEILHSLFEGEATFVETFFINMPPAQHSWIEELFKGFDPGSYNYEIGHQYFLRLFDQGGWEAVRDWTSNIPNSTEQLTHPEKRAPNEVDQPTQLTLPELPEELGELELILDTTIGELGIYHSFFMRADNSALMLAAIGWDGDHLQVYKTEEGKRIALWRTIWDRGEDADQFQRIISNSAFGSVSRKGLMVDWVFAEDLPEKEEIVSELLNSHPHPNKANPLEDANSARIIESMWPDTDIDWETHTWNWVFPRYGIKIPVPFETGTWGHVPSMGAIHYHTSETDPEQSVLIHQSLFDYNPENLEGLKEFLSEQFNKVKEMFGLEMIKEDSNITKSPSGQDVFVLEMEYNGPEPERERQYFIMVAYKIEQGYFVLRTGENDAEFIKQNRELIKSFMLSVRAAEENETEEETGSADEPLLRLLRRHSNGEKDSDEELSRLLRRHSDGEEDLDESDLDELLRLLERNEKLEDNEPQ
ncbi:hypothetical protein ACFLRA_02875 [Bdellovibrionota bacterium]